MTDISNIIEAFGHFLTTQDTSLQFCSLQFLALFVVFFFGYLLIGQRRRTAMMGYVVAFSLFFAFKANGVLMLLLPVTTALSWQLTRTIRQSETPRWRNIWLAVVIIADLLPLLYFKYTNFLVSSISALFASNFAPLDIFLPVGISFYTFQAISYSVDVYRNRFKEDVTLLEYAFYLTFFPLLFAGPITRAGTLLTQLRDKHHLILQRSVYAGLWLIMVGLLKKGLIADYIAQYNNWIFEDPMGYSGFEDMVGVLGYALQIYLDFSGYSDISIGLAALLGFRLRENFSYPYQSLNVTEFWHRWHISLSTWFRDYLYIPMGGNRVGRWHHYWNLFFTMIVAGLWHGASWMFVIWGAMHGAAQVVHKMCRPWLDRIPNNLPVRIISCGVTFVFLLFTWVFFRSPDIPTALSLINRIFTDFDIAYAPPFFGARPMYSLFLIIGYSFLFMHDRTFRLLERMFVESPWMLKLILMIVTIQLLINFSTGSIQPFIYSQF
ncbi:MAG: MBOAT family protein [Prevotella sp.]|nr:MBOAT family protein [Prevotella sp.]